MQFRVFTVPIANGGAADEMNRFLAGHRILAVHREFVSDGTSSCWTFCVEYLEVPGGGMSGNRRERVDYKEVLPPVQFEVFSRLRECRRELAQRDGLPAFAVCTDEQLAAMAKIAPLTPSNLKQIDGIGEAKVEKYGEALIAAHGQPGSAS